jgi:hypothetical protein
MVAHACNPKLLGKQRYEAINLRPNPGKMLGRPYLKEQAECGCGAYL